MSADNRCIDCCGPAGEATLSVELAGVRVALCEKCRAGYASEDFAELALHRYATRIVHARRTIERAEGRARR